MSEKHHKTWPRNERVKTVFVATFFTNMGERENYSNHYTWGGVKFCHKDHSDQSSLTNLLLPGQEPAGAIVGVLAAGLQVEVVEPPVLKLLAEVLDTHLQHTTVGLTYKSTQSNYVFAGKVKVRVENEAASCPWSCS